MAEHSAAEFDAEGEERALRAFWARREAEQAAAQAAEEEEAARLAEAMMSEEAAAGTGLGEGMRVDPPPAEEGGRAKRPRQAVDYEALAKQMEEEEAAKKQRLAGGEPV